MKLERKKKTEYCEGMLIIYKQMLLIKGANDFVRNKKTIFVFVLLLVILSVCLFSLFIKMKWKFFGYYIRVLDMGMK